MLGLAGNTVRQFFLFLIRFKLTAGLSRIIRYILTLLFLGIGYSAFSQKQLIVLSREDVLVRLYPGDEFIYKLKGDRSVTTTYVNNLSDTAVVTHSDTIPFHRIDRVYFKQRRFYNTIGTALVIFGGGLFLIDQANVVLVNGQSPNLDDRVSVLSLSSLAAGLPLMLLKKKSQKLGHRRRLMMVEKGSAFYRPDTRQYIQPYGIN
jgi:hypothetical protein